MKDLSPACLHRLKQSKLLRHAAKIGLTGVAFWFVFRGVDAEHLRDIWQTQNHSLLLLAMALLLFQVLVGAFRWRLILAAIGNTDQGILSMKEALRIYYISVFFNCCLPGTVGGDLVRVFLAKSDRIPTPLAIHSVIIDRMIALAALALIVVVTLPMLGQMGGFNGSIFMLPLLLLGALGVALVFHIERVLGRFRHVRVIHWLLYFVSSLRLLLSHPVASAVSLAYASAGHIAFCLCGYVLARSMNIELTVLQSIALMPPVMLAATLPISIGGWGVREAGMVTMLAFAGVQQAGALMLSLQLGLVSIVMSLPAGLLWLMRRPAKGLPDAASLQG